MTYSSAFEIRLARADDWPVISAQYAYADDKTADVLRWQYSHPSVAGKSVVVVAVSEGRLLGTQAFIPVPAVYQSIPHLSYKSEMTFVHPDARGQGLFDAMSQFGFLECRKLGGTCVWGFTTAVKPFTATGYSILAPLYEETWVWKPIRAYWHMKRGMRWNICTPPVNWHEANLSPVENTFGCKGDRDWLAYRYRDNPRRSGFVWDARSSVLFSSGGQRSGLARVSEARNLTSIKQAIASHKSELKSNYLGLWRFSNHPANRGVVPWPALYRVKESPMKMVWRWITEGPSMQMHDFWVEEGWMQGTD